MSKQSKESKATERTRKKVFYPKHSLLDALKIAEAIKEHNNGNPYDRLDLAKALNTTPSSSNFRLLITASSQFGLTEGSYNAKKISLTPLGKSIVIPKDENERADGLKTALLSIPFYNKFFSDFDNGKLPTLEFLEGTLHRTYGIPMEDCKRCYGLIVKNSEELGILDDISGSKYIHLSKIGTSVITPETLKEDKPPAIIPPESLPIPPQTIRISPQGKEEVNITVNISFELPIAKDVDVYDRIFQSLKRNILSRESKED